MNGYRLKSSRVIYAVLDPKTGGVVYVGLSASGYRAVDRVLRDKNVRKGFRLWLQNACPDFRVRPRFYMRTMVEILEEVMDPEVCLKERKKFWKSQYKGLFNRR